MQRFQFRLDRVLEWYRKRLRMEEGRLAACLDLVHGAERKIALLAKPSARPSKRSLLERATIPAADFLNLARYRLRARQRRSRAGRRAAAPPVLGGRAARARAARATAGQAVRKDARAPLAEYTAEEARELESVAADAYLSRWSQERCAN